MTRINFAYILLILVILTSCDNNYSYKKEEEKTKFKIVDLSYVNNDHNDILNGNFEHKSFSYINSRRTNSSIEESKYRVSNFSHLLLDSNNDFEMEFKHDIYDGYDVKAKYRKIKQISGYNYFVGFNKGKQNGYIIGWRNKGEPDKQVSWEVGLHTDSLISTLSYKTIKNMFPAFKGNYTQVKVDSVVIPYFADKDKSKQIQTNVFLRFTRIFGDHKWFKYKNFFEKEDPFKNKAIYKLEE